MLGFDYQVQRTKRKKSAAIKVENGKVVVLIPQALPEASLLEILHKKAPWIRKKLHESAQVASATAKRYVGGESFTFLGKPYCLQPSTALPAGKIRLGHEQLEVGLELGLAADLQCDQIKQSLITWYVQQASEQLLAKTHRYAQLMQLKPNLIRVKSYKARWGSCSSRGEISYNWKLIIAPHEVVDYVVIHELCHLIHLNHSAAFWQAVERYCPDYKTRRQWLKENGKFLVV